MLVLPITRCFLWLPILTGTNALAELCVCRFGSVGAPLKLTDTCMVCFGHLEIGASDLAALSFRK